MCVFSVKSSLENYAERFQTSSDCELHVILTVFPAWKSPDAEEKREKKNLKPFSFFIAWACALCIILKGVHLQEWECENFCFHIGAWEV